jgi:tRNA 2-(methylsulfanyl)-N6-isopentenyladenosine37 hydroxylase
MRLRTATPAAWTEVVLADLDAFLVDHAFCERKAAATAMVLVNHGGDRPELVRAMIELAREELEHFRLVHEVLLSRGLRLGRDGKDPYVALLMKEVRTGRDTHLLDRLLVAGLVEARSCERLGLVAAALPGGELRALYEELTRAEARHHALFVRLARQAFDPAGVEARLDELLDAEAAIAAGLPLRAAVH